MSVVWFQGEVNCVKWDPTGTLLASCSDDITAKVSFSYLSFGFVLVYLLYICKWYVNVIIRFCLPGAWYSWFYFSSSLHKLFVVLSCYSFNLVQQIWNMKQDKYVHDLREHSKVPLADDIPFINIFDGAHACFMFDNIKWLVAGDIYYQMESHWPRN